MDGVAALKINVVSVSISQSRYFSFQDQFRDRALSDPLSLFQSRNRDTSLFRRDAWRCRAIKPAVTDVSISQSRYFSFQGIEMDVASKKEVAGFNLAIEILLFSGAPSEWIADAPTFLFQSRNRDTSLFRKRVAEGTHHFLVSISQSRYFSFQGHTDIPWQRELQKFQSRNRDTSLFRFRRCL